VAARQGDDLRREAGLEGRSDTLIEHYQPEWNVSLAGFGNRSRGANRQHQRLSEWDRVYCGRAL
jgi:Eco29kI restriction endonuclease